MTFSKTFSPCISNLRKMDIICWGVGKHFYSTTYRILIETGLISNVKMVVDSKVTDINAELAPLLADYPISKPDMIREKLSNDTIILISIYDYGLIVEEIENDPHMNSVMWLPDRFLDMLISDERLLNVTKPSDSYRKNSQMTIPKVINSFWFSNDPIPEKYRNCIDSWKRYCPTYDIRIWSLNDYDSKGNRYFEEAISARKWAFASDYSRIDVICENGGVYMDLDVEMVRPIDDLLFNDAYLGFENCYYIDCGSGFGAVKGNRILKEIRAEYEDRPFILADGSFDETTCPQIYTKVLKKHGLKTDGGFQRVGDITVYPFEYLGAKSYLTGIVYNTKNTYTVHHHEGSWVSETELAKVNSRYDFMDRFGKVLTSI